MSLPITPTHQRPSASLLDMHRLPVRALQLSAEPITLRDLFRVLWVKLHALPPHTHAVPRSLLEGLRRFFIYRHRSLYRLRYFVRRALRDPRCNALVATTITPPVDSDLGDAVRSAYPDLRQVIVVPSLAALDPEATNTYLGTVAAQVFAPHFADGHRIGLGGGRAIVAFAKALPQFTTARRLHFYALTRFRGPLVFVADAEKAISELIVDCRWRQFDGAEEKDFEGVLNPRVTKGQELDWAFIGIGALADNSWREYADELVFDFSAAQKAGAVAEVLFHFFSPDGAPPARPIVAPLGFETARLSVLREMVRLGRPVVALAGGKEKAIAVLAAYRSRRAGGALFNCLVTDEDCAAELLRRAENPRQFADVPRRAVWWERKHRFFAAHLKYATPTRKTNADIAAVLKAPRKKVQRWLKEAAEGTGDEPPLVSFTVRAPSPEYALELALIQRYDLLDARVVPFYADTAEQLVQVGLAAAQLFCELVRDRDRFCVGLGSGYEVRAMVECLALPETLQRFERLKHLEFWALSESPILTLSQGVGAQTIVSSIALRCGTSAVRSKVRCYRFDPHRNFEGLDAMFFTLRAPYPDDLNFLRAAGLACGDPAAAVGYLLNQQFDARGEALLPDGVACSAPLTALRALTAQSKPVIALNARCDAVTHHARALRVACMCQLVNGLVVPRPLAETLLQPTPP